MHRGLRWAVLGFSWLIIAIGVLVQVLPLPLHGPGLLIIVAGLIILLRNSYTARRRFIRYQRRHPKIFYPMRRLLRRKPEIAPVLWQQSLRLERWVLPPRYRFCRRLRLTVMRRRRRRAP